MERKNTTKTIRREACFQADLHVRESEGGSESRTIEGYVLKFGVRSVLLRDWWNPYYEILEPGCVTREMLDKCNIPLTMFHDRELVIARSKNGKGTLSYTVDGLGTQFNADVARTADGDKALELVRRGDLDGCSFVYSTDEMDPEAVTYEASGEKDADGNDILLRHVWRIDNIKDFTLTGNAAYEQTECVAREAPDGYTFDRKAMKMVREADVKADRTALEAAEAKKREEEAAQQAAAKQREALKREQVEQLRRAADTLREFIN